MRRILLFVILVLYSWSVLAQKNSLLSFIQDKSDIREGGSGYFLYDGDTYVISVAAVIVGQKTELDCKKVGSTKAKREMIAFANGSEITSFTELSISETVQELLDARKVNASQFFREVIREKVLGTISEVNTLGGWYSDDRSVYYYALYKILE